MGNEFAHLHVHSKYSPNDGMAKVEDLVKRASELEFKHIALTDHGKMGGIPRLAVACKKYKMHGIVGCEIYVCDDMNVKQHIEEVQDDGIIKKRRPWHQHLVLLCASEKGYNNLISINNIANTEGFYYEPRVDRSVIAPRSEGLIALSGCLSGEIARAIINHNEPDKEKRFQNALQIASDYKDIFGDRYFLEVQYHADNSVDTQKAKDLERLQREVALSVFKISEMLSIPVVATNDVHYLNHSDWAAHTMLKGIRVNDPANTGYGYPTGEFYLKSADRMYSRWKGKEEICKNTLLVAEMCEWEFPACTHWKFPNFEIEDNSDFDSWKQNKAKFMTEHQAYLYYLCEKGLRNKKLIKDDTALKRCKYELDIIFEMGVEEYFLIIWDVFEYCRKNNIAYGPGRGSGAGSLVLYLLDVICINPLDEDLNLIFERFLNPGRCSIYDFELPGCSIEWYKNEKSKNPDKINKKLREIVFQSIKTREDYTEVWSKCKKEILPLENQELDDYYVECMEYSKINGPVPNKANSWIAYSLGITNEKPTGQLILIEQGSLPDVDSDFDPMHRDDIIQYCKNKYGSDKVSNIGTYGEYGAKSTIQSILKLRGYKPEDAAEVSKSIPFRAVRAYTLEEALHLPSFRQTVERFRVPKDIFGIVSTIEGSAFSNVSEHAAGIVISPISLLDTVPLHRSKDTLVTQYDLKDIEKAGFIKFDFLGLNNVAKIALCLELIEKQYGEKIDITKVPRNDKLTLSVFREGKTSTVFQFSSNGMRSALRDIKVDSFEDLIAVAALYRPGPMKYISRQFYLENMTDDDMPFEEGMTYAENKAKPHTIKYMHPDLEPILKPTHGILVYQEQAMEIAKTIGGFTMSQADELRSAIGKKDEDKFQKCKTKFIEGAKNNNYSYETALQICHLMKDFGSYAFNKAHSAVYAILGYWNAYLLGRYKYEWYAACLTIDADKETNCQNYIREMSMLKVNFIRPNVKQSESRASVMYNEENKPTAVVMPLITIKGLGKVACQKINGMRPYDSFRDFCEKVNPSKSTVTILLKEGALDIFGDRYKMHREFDEWKFDQSQDRKHKKKKVEINKEILDLFKIDFSRSVEASIPSILGKD